MTIDIGSTPRAFVQDYTSFEAYAAASGLLRVHASVRLADRFRARMAFINLGSVTVRRAEASAGLSMTGDAPDKHSFTFAIKPAGPRLFAGREVADDVLYHPRPNDTLYATSPNGRPWPWASVGWAYDELDSLGTALAGRAVSCSRTDAAILLAPPAARQRLHALVHEAAAMARAASDHGYSPAAAKALGGALSEALVDCLAQGRLDHDRSAVRRHHRIMARLEAVLEERGDTILTLSELCAAVGTAQRTLHLVCHEFLAMSPMAYLRTRRLSRVRVALLAAAPGEVKVSDVAASHGFWAFGRFSRAYFQAFGEFPSETLRAPRWRDG
jgi:AraC-like DNA-binding protein